jgi:hypothetical protein
MKTLAFAAVALSLTSFCSGTSAPKSASQSNKIAGDYVEVRTSSVFTGACHYNGELVTTGRDALMAWRFTSGTWNGVDLSGLKVVAAISSDANLGQEQAARKTELVIDARASEQQATALTALLREKCGARLGEIAGVRQANISFEHAERGYAVTAEDFASLSVQPMPNGECCKQPHLVWYSPLAPLDNRKVGYTVRAAYTAGTVGDAWSREGENSAFYGSFSF